MADRYRDATGPLGGFFLRTALRTGDSALEMKAWELLRPDFPTGVEPLVLNALDVPPADGVVLGAYGKRPAAAGLRRDDVIVGVDAWRARNVAQYIRLARLSHDDAITLTVWRNGRYQQLRTRVPERSLGVDLHNFPR